MQVSVGSTIAPGPASPAAAFTPVLRVALTQNVPTWIGRARSGFPVRTIGPVGAPAASVGPRHPRSFVVQLSPLAGQSPFTVHERKLSSAQTESVGPA